MPNCLKTGPRPIALAILFGSFFGVGLSDSQGAVIYLKGSTQPMTGYIVSQDDRRVTLRRTLPSGVEREDLFLREQIELVVETVSAERLQKLTPDNPNAYRDYAEELAVKWIDPEARDAAVRLYLIAAYIDNGTIQKSALRGLVANARSTLEERKFRTLAYRSTGYDATFLRQVITKRSPNASTDPKAKTTLLNSVKAARRGDFLLASELLDSTEVQKELANYEDVMTLETLVGICLNELITKEELNQLLKIELLLSSSTRSPGRTTKHREENWSQLVSENELSPIFEISFLTVTEFDPRKCVFRDGNWQLP